MAIRYYKNACHQVYATVRYANGSEKQALATVEKGKLTSFSFNEGKNWIAVTEDALKERNIRHIDFDAFVRLVVR